MRRSCNHKPILPKNPQVAQISAPEHRHGGYAKRLEAVALPYKAGQLPPPFLLILMNRNNPAEAFSQIIQASNLFAVRLFYHPTKF